MDGENFVILKGKLTSTNIKPVGQYNSNKFSAKLAIPSPNPGANPQYIKIAAFGNLADALNSISKDKLVKIHGHIEEQHYDGRCRHCGGYDRKYWTEVLVDNFIVED
jgi:hypothetical protein